MRPTRSVALFGGTSMLAALLALGVTPARGQGLGTPPTPGTYAPTMPRLPRLAAPAPGDGVVPASTAAMPAPPSPTIPPPAYAPAPPPPAEATDSNAPRSYFRAAPPPAPPTRLSRFRDRMHKFMGSDRDEAGNPNEHIPYDPSTGRSHIPAFSRPWLKPPGTS